MARFSKLRKDEFITRSGKIRRKPKDDRCNKGHLLWYDTKREVWDCPICIKEMQLEEIEQDMKDCPECSDMRMQGLIPACCQEHLDEQMNLHDYQRAEIEIEGRQY